MVRKTYKSLSKKYHGRGHQQLTRAEVEAYATARMPATMDAIRSVLAEITNRISHKISSFLDLGAGPGSGLLAVKEFFTIEKAVLIEKNPHMVEKGKQFVDADWIIDDFINVKPLDIDLALFGYSLGELPENDRLGSLKKVWEKTKTLVLIEPGTPKGYSVILEARKQLIQWGGNMVAPCPHIRKCPMEGNDWCHFSTRLQRTKEHKQEKGANLGWEDEKFSYVVFSKKFSHPAKARIVRHPQKRKGHVSLQICGQNGLEEKIISQRQKVEYKKARKLKWGSEFAF